MMKPTLFISDLHLQPDEPMVAAIFMQFLRDQAIHAEAVYILGDLFEAWIGDDDLNPFNQQIIQAIKKVTQTGIKVYFMHGNRDFLIGKKFAEMTGIQLLADPTLINLYGRPTLLMHGDSLCAHDRKHQRWRRMTQNPLLQKIALLLPLPYRKQIGQWLRNQSRNHLKHLPDYIMDVSSEAVTQQMQIFRAAQLIHGHTHRPGFHDLTYDNNCQARRMVLGAWHQTGHVLVCNSERCEPQILSEKIGSNAGFNG